jgi:hypothetical protein
MIQAIILLASMLAGVSLIFGGLVALVVIIWVRELDAAVRLVVNSYYGLIGLMPISLWFAIYTSHDDREHGEPYNSPLSAIVTVLQGAIVGSILGAGPIFLAVVVNLPVILADFEIAEFGQAVSSEIVWSRLIFAVGAALISSIPLGFWAYYQKSGQEID